MERTSALSMIVGCLVATGASAELPGGVRVGRAHVVQDLTVFPMLADAQEKLGRIVTLEAALKDGSAIVSERTDGAQVHSLTIANRGDAPVYVLAGTLVRGGNQDRQVSQDFVVPPREQMAVDAFCVEQGRWDGVRAGRSTGGRFGTMKALAGRKVRAAGQYERDQQEVWRQVAEVNRMNKKHAESGTLMATLDAPDVTAAREDLVEKAKRALRDGDFAKTVGLGYAVRGQVKGVRWFANHDLYVEFEDALLGTAAVDAVTAREGGRPRAAEPVASMAVGDFVGEIESASTAEERDTGGANRNEYKRSRRGYGSKTRLKASPANVLSHDYLSK